MDMDLYTIVGICGASIILLAFILNELHHLSNDSLAYDIMNLVGAVLLCLYAYLISSWPFLVLNAVWAIVSARDVMIDLMRKPRV